jgi:propanol-preferring alcohol dehydrogenase
MSELPALDHQKHLFNERDLRTVTANTRRDGEELLRLASRLPLKLQTTVYPFEIADQALGDLAAGRVSGSAVVEIAQEPPVARQEQVEQSLG